VQDHSVDPAKDSRGGGNTERQSKHCDRGESRGPAEHTCCVPEVFKNASHRIVVFQRNWASDCRCLILFNGAVNQLSISGGGVRKWKVSYGRSLSDRNAYPQIEISDAQQIESHLRDRSGSTAWMYADTWRIPC
jgi:hypothetical protein